MTESHAPKRTRRRRPIVLAAAIGSVAMLLLLLVSPGGATARRQVDKRPLMGQADSAGERSAIDGARTIVTRSDSWVKVDVLMPTPQPGSYIYPDPGSAPGGAFHPDIVPGSPEVFTLWMFHFRNPELCSDGQCGSDDFGDTPAQGGVYRLDGAIADGPWIHLDAIVVNGQEATDFVSMADAATGEFHIAVAPHGAAHTDPESLLTQLNLAVGSPDQGMFGGVYLPD